MYYLAFVFFFSIEFLLLELTLICIRVKVRFRVSIRCISAIITLAWDLRLTKGESATSTKTVFCIKQTLTSWK